MRPVVELYRGNANEREQLGGFFQHDRRRQRIFIFFRDGERFCSKEGKTEEECLEEINKGHEVCKMNVFPLSLSCSWKKSADDGTPYSIVVSLTVTLRHEDISFWNAWGDRILETLNDNGCLYDVDISKMLESKAFWEVEKIQLRNDDINNFDYWSDIVLGFALNNLGLRCSRVRSVRIERFQKTSDSWSGGSVGGDRQTLNIRGEDYGFVWIPPGEFDMGSPDDERGRFSNERLCHVKLTQGFWMLETPTTQRLYESIMGENPSLFKGDDLPVETVSYEKAVVFCDRLSKAGILPNNLIATLPTEAQWERACRAGTQTAYYWGDDFGVGKLNSKEGRCCGTSSVKNYAPNDWGLFDMLGNVFEWQLNWYEEDYPLGILVDPQGPDKGETRAARGGAWDYGASSCRCANRANDVPNYTAAVVGFRVCLIYNDRGGN